MAPGTGIKISSWWRCKRRAAAAGAQFASARRAYLGPLGNTILYEGRAWMRSHQACRAGCAAMSSDLPMAATRATKGVMCASANEYSGPAMNGAWLLANSCR